MSTSVAKSLEDKLKERQAKEGLSDYKFAEKLGVSHQLWQMTRTGQRLIPKPSMLEGIAKAYPELAPDVLIFLGFDVDASPLTQDLSTKPHQTLCSGCQRVLRGLARALFSLGLWGGKTDQATKSKSEVEK